MLFSALGIVFGMYFYRGLIFTKMFHLFFAPSNRIFFAISMMMLMAFSPCLAQRYDGQRLGLFQFEWANKKKNIIRCTVVNTGRVEVSFDKNRHAPSSLVIEMDTISLPIELKSHQESIRSALLQQKIILSPGQLIGGLELKISFSESLNVEVAKPGVQAESITNSESQAPEQQELSSSAARNGGASSAAAAEQKPKPASSSNASVKEELTLVDTSITASTEFFDYSKNCPDIVLDSVWLVSQSNRNLILGFVVKNIGHQPARIVEEKTKETNNNLALNIYFASGTKLTRGSILADGIFFGQGADNPSGMLAPDGKMSGQISIGTTNRTKFSPNIIFEIDPFHSIQECDETNNTKALELEY